MNDCQRSISRIVKAPFSGSSQGGGLKRISKKQLKQGATRERKKRFWIHSRFHNSELEESSWAWAVIFLLIQLDWTELLCLVKDSRLYDVVCFRKAYFRTFLVEPLTLFEAAVLLKPCSVVGQNWTHLLQRWRRQVQHGPSCWRWVRFGIGDVDMDRHG